MHREVGEASEKRQIPYQSVREPWFFTIVPGYILYMEYPFGHLHGRTYLAHMSSKNRCTEAVVHLNNRVNAPLNLKENCTLKGAF